MQLFYFPGQMDGQETANSNKDPTKSYDFNVSDFSFDSEIKKEVKLEPNQNESSVKVEQVEVQKVDHREEKSAGNEETGDKNFSCHICSKNFNQFELEMHFVECLQDDSNDNCRMPFAGLRNERPRWHTLSQERCLSL